MYFDKVLRIARSRSLSARDPTESPVRMGTAQPVRRPPTAARAARQEPARHYQPASLREMHAREPIVVPEKGRHGSAPHDVPARPPQRVQRPHRAHRRHSAPAPRERKSEYYELERKFE